MSKLVIQTQPGTAADGIDFYKDEGGKGNWMRLVVTLSAASSLRTQLNLQTKLFFESGLPVEESDQKILVVRPGASKKDSGSRKDSKSGGKGTIEKLTIGPGRKNCTIEFRIQKVSRRKDNQRFKVEISVQGDDTVAPAFTRPITVLSKRKIPARLRNDPEAIARYKAEKANKTKKSRKRSRSDDATPEMRPHSALHKSEEGHKRQCLPGGVDKALYSKIEHMSRTVDNLYAIMVDQRVQISRLQEQVRVLIDNQDPMYNDIMVPPQPIPTTGMDILIAPGSPRLQHSHQLFNEESTGRKIAGSPSFRSRKSSSHLRKERDVKMMLSGNDTDALQWSFDGSLSNLPELNL